MKIKPQLVACLIWLPLFVMLMIGCSQVSVSHEPRATALHLFQLIHTRLSIMKEVAAFKFQAGLPIEDTHTEKVVIHKAIEKAAAYDLEPQGIQALMVAQIEAAKDIQRNYFRQWQEAQTLPPLPSHDLHTHIRPELAAISQNIIETLGKFLAEGGQFSQEVEHMFYETVPVKNLSPGSVVLLFHALRYVRVEKATTKKGVSMIRNPSRTS